MMLNLLEITSQHTLWIIALIILKELLKVGIKSLGFCITYENQKVGIIALTEKQDKSLSWGSAIIKEYQGKGIATKAFELIVGEAQRQGYTKIISSCAKNNIASRNLHKKVGFDLIKEEVNSAGNEMCRWEMNI